MQEKFLREFGKFSGRQIRDNLYKKCYLPVEVTRVKEFENRKSDHLRLALHPDNEAAGQSGLEKIQLMHEALPEMDFAELKIESKFWKYAAASPHFISSMTAGHAQGEPINLTLARVCAEKRWPLGVGSQRRELNDPEASREWKKLRQSAPKVALMGNLGLSQLIHTKTDDLLRLLDALEPIAFFIHTNPLQEALQPEGTTHFKGGRKAIEKFCKISNLPVILKETGCGFSAGTLRRLRGLGLAAVDISGFGGTHWGRIEGDRGNSVQKNIAVTFRNWGISTLDSMMATRTTGLNIWASGGIRSGLDAAKCIALGAQKVGFAKPALENAIKGEELLASWMDQVERELKIALFCTGSKSPEALRKGKKWQKI